MFTQEQFTKLLESTLLKPSATKEDVTAACKAAAKQHFACMVVFPFYLRLATEILQNSDVKPASVVGFPFGADGRSIKVFQAKTAIANGAKELDIVVNIPAIKSGEYAIAEREITEIVDSVATIESKHTVLKFIIECHFLNDYEKKRICEIIKEAGGDFIQTSTGTAPTGATPEDISLIRKITGPDIGIKAAGGIRTVPQAIEMLDAGANRIGTSSAYAIASSYVPDDYL